MKICQIESNSSRLITIPFREAIKHHQIKGKIQADRLSLDQQSPEKHNIPF